MAHKCFISFKTEDMDYKKKIQEDMVLRQEKGLIK